MKIDTIYMRHSLPPNLLMPFIRYLCVPHGRCYMSTVLMGFIIVSLIYWEQWECQSSGQLIPQWEMKSYLKFYSNCKILNDIEKSCSPAHVMWSYHRNKIMWIVKIFWNCVVCIPINDFLPSQCTRHLHIICNVVTQLCDITYFAPSSEWVPNSRLHSCGVPPLMIGAPVLCRRW